MGGQDRTQAYVIARNRAVEASFLAGDILKGQASWRVAKAHNAVANDYRRERAEGLETSRTPLAGRALGEVSAF